MKAKKKRRAGRWELRREKYMTRDEVLRLRRCCEDRAAADLAKGRKTGVRVWAVIDLVSQTGLRVAEVANVRIRDLELPARPPVLWVVGGKARSKDEREAVTLSTDLAKHLKDYLEHKGRIGEGTDPKDFLFVSERGGKYSTRALQLLFKHAAKTAGLPAHYSIHALRHSWGTYLYQKTKDLRLVQKELRHKSPQTTAIYADVTPEERAKAVNGVWAEGGEATD
jgi:integrase/recombinase XerD